MADGSASSDQEISALNDSEKCKLTVKYWYHYLWETLGGGRYRFLRLPRMPCAAPRLRRLRLESPNEACSISTVRTLLKLLDELCLEAVCINN